MLRQAFIYVSDLMSSCSNMLGKLDKKLAASNRFVNFPPSHFLTPSTYQLTRFPAYWPASFKACYF
jgi:hypothetical protein